MLLDYHYLNLSTTLFWYYFLQEYIASKPSNAARSLMYLIDMLLHDAINAPDAENNKNIRTWAIVSYIYIYLSLCRLSEYTCHILNYSTIPVTSWTIPLYLSHLELFHYTCHILNYSTIPVTSWTIPVYLPYLELFHYTCHILNYSTIPVTSWTILLYLSYLELF